MRVNANTEMRYSATVFSCSNPSLEYNVLFSEKMDELERMYGGLVQVLLVLSLIRRVHTVFSHIMPHTFVDQFAGQL